MRDAAKVSSYTIRCYIFFIDFQGEIKKPGNVGHATFPGFRFGRGKNYFAPPAR